MFSTGFDLGSLNCVIAVTQKRGIDVIPNEAGYRQTFNGVCFTDEGRKLGDGAKSSWGRNMRNTVVDIKQLLGRRFNDPEVQRNLPWLWYEVVEMEDGGCGVVVHVEGERRVLRPQQVVAMILKHMSNLTAANQGSKVTDVVVAVPSWWPDGPRRAMRDATAIAGLQCLSLIDEVSAAAQLYGLTKLSLEQLEAEQGSRDVIFFDVGYSGASASFVRFAKGKVKVLGREEDAVVHKVLATATDPTLGAKELDRALWTHFAAEIKERYRLDVGSNKRAKLRLLQAVERVKKVLTANSVAPLNVESLMEDKDIALKIDRQTFEGLIAEQLRRLTGPLQTVLDTSGVPVSDVHSLEVVGEGWRPKAVLEGLSAFFGGRPISRTLPSAEAVARGAALQCARDGHIQKVKNYGHTDTCPYSIQACLEWNVPPGTGEGDVAAAAAAAPMSTVDEGVLLFAPGNNRPSSKAITQPRKQLVAGTEVTVRLSYARPEQLPAGTPEAIGSWKITGIPANTEAQLEPVVKVTVRMDAGGVVRVLKAEKVYKEQRMVTLEKPMTPEEIAEVEAAEAAEAAAAAAAAADTMDESPDEEAATSDGAAAAAGAEAEASSAPEKPATPPPPAAAAAAAAAPKKKKRTKTVEEPQMFTQKVALTVTLVEATQALTPAQVQEMTAAEDLLTQRDQLIAATEAARNAVESYIYDTRGKLFDAWYDFVEAADRDAFKAQLDTALDWLYDEGESAPKEQLDNRLVELKTVGNPIQARWREAEERPHAVERLRATIQRYRQWVATEEEAYAHIDAEKRAQVTKHVDEAQAWLDQALAAQEALPKTAPPSLVSADIGHRADNLQTACQAIVDTPKPKPKEPEKKTPTEDNSTPPPATEEEKPQEQQEGDNKEEATPAAQAEQTAEGDKMDTAA